MGKRVFVTMMVVAAAVVLTVGGVVASNMGFKANVQLLAADGGVTSLNGTNTLALPFNRQTNVDTASDLLNDLGGTANVLSVQKFLRASNTFQVYTGLKGTAPNFNLNPGEGNFVRISSNIDYIAVGSHDPSAGVDFFAADGGVNSLSGTNLYAVPYHTTAGTASDLLNELGGTAVVLSVQKFLRETNSFQVYTGLKGTAPNFDLEVGNSYFVRVGSDVLGHIPAHY